MAAGGDGHARGPRLRDRPEHDPRRLPRRRVVSASGRHDRCAGRADRRVALGRAGQAGRRRQGRVTEREIERKPLADRPKTGRGSLAFRVDDTQGGRYIVRVAGTDRFGNPIVADRVLTISGKKDETKLRLLADRQRFKVGEEASVNLHSRDRAGTALLTWEADRILDYKIVTLKEGDNPVAWAIDGPQFPNFTLTSTRMWRNECDQAKLDIQVERDLRVTVAPAKPVVGPGEPVELEVTTVDQLGRPVAAELSIAMVDQSLLRLFDDTLPAIGPFFYNQTRTGAFATEATNTFRYAPATVPVSQAVVDEAERLAAVAANEADRKDVMNRAGATRSVATRELRRVARRGDCRQRREWVRTGRLGAALQQRRTRRTRRSERYGKSVDVSQRLRDETDQAGRCFASDENARRIRQCARLRR